MNWSLQQQKPRRIAAVSHYLSFGLCLVLINLHIYADPVAWALVTGAGIYLVSGLCLMTITWPYGISGTRWSPSSKVDERQKQVRSEALAYSFWITSCGVFFLYLWIQTAVFWSWLWRPQTLAEWSNVLWVCVMATSMLPAAIIAWNEPNMLEEITSPAMQV